MPFIISIYANVHCARSADLQCLISIGHHSDGGGRLATIDEGYDVPALHQCLSPAEHAPFQRCLGRGGGWEVVQNEWKMHPVRKWWHGSGTKGGCEGNGTMDKKTSAAWRCFERIYPTQWFLWHTWCRKLNPPGRGWNSDHEQNLKIGTLQEGPGQARYRCCFVDEAKTIHPADPSGIQEARSLVGDKPNWNRQHRMKRTRLRQIVDLLCCGRGWGKSTTLKTVLKVGWISHWVAFFKHREFICSNCYATIMKKFKIANHWPRFKKTSSFKTTKKRKASFEILSSIIFLYMLYMYTCNKTWIF